MTELKIVEKRWSKDLEKPIYEAWKKSNRYAFDKSNNKKVFL